MANLLLAIVNFQPCLAYFCGSIEVCDVFDNKNTILILINSPALINAPLPLF